MLTQKSIRVLSVAAIGFAAMLFSKNSHAVDGAAGPYGGVEFRGNMALMGGGEFRLGLKDWSPGHLVLRPYLSLYSENNTQWATGCDVFFGFFIGSRFVEPYVGGGLGIVKGDVGVDITGGVKFRNKDFIQPFVEFRTTEGPRDTTSILGGVMFQLF